MRFTSGIVICLSLGIVFPLYADDFLSEYQEEPADIKVAGYSSEAAEPQDLPRKSYIEWKNSEAKKVKKVPIRQRLGSPYRGFALVNLAATTSVSESASFDSESTSSDNNGENDEGVIEVAYAQELLNRSLEAVTPISLNYERW